MQLPTTPRGTLRSVGAVLAGGVSAAMFAVAMAHMGTLLVFLIYISSVPLYLAGLGIGSVAGCIASAIGIVSLYATQPASYATTYAVFSAVPAILLIVLAMRHRTGSDGKAYWYPEGFLMTAIALYPCALFLTIFVMTASHPGGLLDLTTQTFQEAAGMLGDKADSSAIDEFKEYIPFMAKLMPSLAGCSWMLITMICGTLSQNYLVKTKRNQRPTFTLQTMHIPTWMIFAVAATGLASQLAPEPFDYISLNLAIMLGVPFLLVGLAIVHAWAATQKAPKVILFAFYLLVGIVPWAMLLVAALGVIDQWVNFRQRFAARPKPNTH